MPKIVASGLAAIAVIVLGAGAAIAQPACRDIPGNNDRPDTGGTSIESAKGIVNSYRSVGDPRAAPPADPAQARNLLAVAKADCARAVNEKKKRIDARLCLGDATYFLGKLGTPSPDVQPAYCNYRAADILIKSDSEARALAREGVARTLEEAGNTNGAIAARESIPAAYTSPDRMFDLAMLYVRATGKTKEAKDLLDAVGHNRVTGHTVSVDMQARSLRELARLTDTGVSNPADPALITLWGEIARLDQKPDAYLRHGELLFRSGGDGSSSLRAAINGPPDISQKANYFLGVISARQASAANLLEAANYSKGAGAGSHEYKRLSCMVALSRGARAITGQEEARVQILRDAEYPCATGAANNLKDGAESNLLQGLFYLRKAQNIRQCKASDGPSCSNLATSEWLDRLSAARAAFNQGSLSLAQASATLPKESMPIRFDWLESAGPQNPELEALLRVGATVSDKLRDSLVSGQTYCRDPVISDPSEPALSFFRSLDLLKCF